MLGTAAMKEKKQQHAVTNKRKRTTRPDMGPVGVEDVADDDEGSPPKRARTMDIEHCAQLDPLRGKIRVCFTDKCLQEVMLWCALRIPPPIKSTLDKKPLPLPTTTTTMMYADDSGSSSPRRQKVKRSQRAGNSRSGCQIQKKVTLFDRSVAH